MHDAWHAHRFKQVGQLAPVGQLVHWSQVLKQGSDLPVVHPAESRARAHNGPDKMSIQLLLFLHCHWPIQEAIHAGLSEALDGSAGLVCRC